MTEYAPQEDRIVRLLKELSSELEPDAGETSATDQATLSDADLQHVIAALDMLSPVVPSEAMTRQLLDNLRPHVPEPRFRSQMQAERGSATSRLLALLSAVKPQVTSLGRPFWYATAILYAAVGIAGLWATSEAGIVTEMFVMLVLPLLAVAGVGFAFRGSRSGFWEAERACPIDPATLALARFSIVTAYAVVLTAVLTLILGILRLQVSLGALFLGWLAPLLFLASITLFVSVRWDGWIGSLAGLGVWAMFILLHVQGARFDLLATPEHGFWLIGKLLLLALTGALWLVGLPWMRRGLSHWRLEVN